VPNEVRVEISQLNHVVNIVLAKKTVIPADPPQGRADCRLAKVENRHLTLRSTHDVVFCKVGGKWKWDKAGKQ